MPRTVRQNILEGARKWKGPVWEVSTGPRSYRRQVSRRLGASDAMLGRTYHREWGCNGSACAGKPSTLLYSHVSQELRYQGHRNPERVSSKSRHIAHCRPHIFSRTGSLQLHTVLPALRSIRSSSLGVRTLCAEELAGDVQGLTSHNDDLLAVEQLLGNGAGEATEQVPLAVDDLVEESARGPVLRPCASVEIAGWQRRAASICQLQETQARVIGAYVQ